MLRFITGRAGTGKTHLLMEQLSAAASDGETGVILVVPEQFSFETERTLWKTLGAETMLRVEVLSFKRLAQMIFRACGGLAGEYLTPPAKAVLMSSVLFDVKEALEFYSSQAENAAFLSALCRTVTAFKNWDVPPDRLKEAADNAPKGTLRQKLSELSLIYQGFEAAIAGKYTDEDDDVARACLLAEQQDFFAGKALFFDQFLGFTGLEYRMISVVLHQCDQVWFSLCAGEKEEPYGLFSPVHDALRRLRAMGKEAGHKIAPPLCLKEPRRFASPELIALEKGMFSSAKEPYPEPPQAVRLIKVQNREEEIVFAAQHICALVREQGYRYRDIVVFARDPEKYRMYIEEIFPAYGIPAFLDKKTDVSAAPVTRFLSALFDCMSSRFATGDVLSLAKSPLIGLSEVEAAKLENYAYVWNITGRRWLAPFTGHPAGLRGEFTPEEQEELAELNRLRAHLVAPVEQLATQLAEGPAEELCRGLYHYLKSQGILSALETLSHRLEEEGEGTLAKEQQEVWQAVLQVMDSIAQGLRGRILTLPRFCRLFSVGLAACQLGKIPEHTDEVLIGDVGRTLSGEKRAALLLGVTEGEFPALSPSGGIFTEQDAQALSQMGLSFAKTGEDSLFDEQLLAYQAMTGVSEQAVFLLPAGDLTGRALSPSGIVRELRAIFPAGLESSPTLRGPAALCTRESALREYFSLQGSPDSYLSTLEAFFSQDPAVQETLSRSRAPRPSSLSHPSLAGKLYGSRLLLSPSRVEKFYQCPFAYYLTYGLRLNTPKRAGLSPIETGSVIHFCLERLVRRYGAKQLSQIDGQALRAAVESLLREYLDQEMGGLSDKPARFGYLFTRLSATVLTLIRQLAAEFDQSAFTPVDFELTIAPGGDVEPVLLRTPDGGTVQVIGRVDRVDTCRIGEETYVRVVDYKTGSAKFSLTEVLQGLGLQMLLYLFTIWQNGSSRYGPTLPAGVLYLPAVNPVVKAGRDTDTETVEKLRRQGLKMNGLVLSDPSVIRAMEGEGKGVFIPVTLKANGEPDARSSVASLQELSQLSQHIDALVIQMAGELRSGKISAAPLPKNGRLPCEYCDYRSICRVDPQES